MKFYKNKKILITGNTGFKGSWLSLTLSSLGSEVIGLSDKSPLVNSVINQDWINKNIKQYYGKIENLSNLKKIIRDEKPDLIFHLAAQPLVLESYKHPYETFKTNMIGTLNLLESIKKIDSSIPSLIITTDKVYKNVNEKKFCENDPLEGLDPYSSSKVCAENISKAYANIGLRIITARSGNVIGGGDWGKHRIVPDIIRSIYKNEIPVIRNPSHTRPWLYILDVIEGYLLLAERLFNKKQPSEFESFNLAPSYSKSFNVLQLTKRLLFHFNKTDYKLEKNVIKRESKILSLEAKKMNNCLNWRAKTSFETAIKETANWYLSANELNTLNISKEQVTKYFKKFSKTKSKKLVINNFKLEKKYA